MTLWYYSCRSKGHSKRIMTGCMLYNNIASASIWLYDVKKTKFVGWVDMSATWESDRGESLQIIEVGHYTYTAKRNKKTDKEANANVHNMLKTVYSMSELGGLWKHQNKAACTRNARVFKLLKLYIQEEDDRETDTHKQEEKDWEAEGQTDISTTIETDSWTDKRQGALTPSLPWCHERAKCETLQFFCLFVCIWFVFLLFRTGMWKNFHQNT